ncbi:TPA: biliverdin-producing heme oxygenase, partial [Pseudomonas aeruginosa]|nr:biliverdin-producing heme oxygenase [Pseudomonas aeruginosa]
ARHLAEPEGGRAQGWKSFVAILDGIELNEEEERLAAKGASDAFNRFGDLLERTFA